ncbi:50S ribosomal protein L6 [Alkalispirochaeta sphaeroplastigenens]|uniref:Large ribosomal subunit protein uL6 n=1 Tax=Alkalispirochaeta sphaeroplastigenens TaxID=1187066 RepID=A0A2S4JGY6_9SPIO|nr:MULTISPECIES: 50S ribosomal protein L6 [Alkalispirochaeta]POQ98771.1 50S ribosomal protein L6 [Alkalispirochaeta sphaeroplastigenens]
MSRIGRLPIDVPKGVTVTVNDMNVTVKGPKGELSQLLRPEVSLEVQDDTVVVSRKNDSKKAKGFHGLYRQLVANMVVGVSQGFSRTLLINGVGYRAEVKGSSVLLNLGYSNPIEYMVPEGITITGEGANKLVVQGIDKQLVGKTASEIRKVRPPEPYKGKGVKYEDEYVRRKVGKSGIK